VRRILTSVVVAVTAWSLASCDSDEQAAPSTSSASTPRSGPLPTTIETSCVRSYDEAGLRAQAFALDATVDSIRRHGKQVDLHVTEWFRGGSGETLTVRGVGAIGGLGDSGADGDGLASESGPAYAVGTRLLVSGQYADDGSLLVWSCGYTRYWTRTDLAGWRAAFGATSAPLPDDRTTVPYVPFGASDAEIVRLLEAAGLVAQVPDVDWPHYVTGVDPVAGTELPVGAEVEILIGDG